MNKLRIIAVLLAVSSFSQASYYAEWGAGFQHPSSEPVSDRMKFVEFGYTEEHKLFDVSYALGGWNDASGIPGVRNSAYVKTLLRLETRTLGIYMGYAFGPAFLFEPDILLGSHFELAHEIEIGFKDTRVVSVSIVVQHLSDGGLSQHNYGRNFIGPKVRF
jgi:hypothetical protein